MQNAIRKRFHMGKALQKMNSEFVRNDEFVQTMRKFSEKVLQNLQKHAIIIA